MEAENKKKNLSWMKLLIILLVIVILFNIWFLLNYTKTGKSIGGNVIAGYDDMTTKVLCKQQPYTDTENYQEKVPYQDTEYYTEIVSGKNCDITPKCICLHKSWLGLGACDSCECEKSQTITKYRTETKSRTVTKFKDVCIKIKSWQSANYNENWLTYPQGIIYSIDRKLSN